MSAASLRRRLAKLEQKAMPASVPGDEPLRRFEAALKKPGVMKRLGHIAEHGASPEDQEWLEQQTRETGFDFNAAVAACAELNEAY